LCREKFIYEPVKSSYLNLENTMEKLECFCSEIGKTSQERRKLENRQPGSPSKLTFIHLGLNKLLPPPE
jgi:hypothetical protein